MLKSGEWRATNPEGEHASFHINQLSNDFTLDSWDRMQKKLLEGSDNKIAKKTFFFSTQMEGLPYKIDGQFVSTRLLWDNREKKKE